MGTAYKTERIWLRYFMASPIFAPHGRKFQIRSERQFV